MGDMKTPDFDDLLAAFDIPDATGLDGKEAIQESHDETEGHLKHTGMCMDDTASVSHSVTATDVPAVSVIVKNTSLQESFESFVEKEGSHLGNLLQNGFRDSGGSLETHQVGHSSYSKLDVSPPNGDCTRGFLEKVPNLYKTEKMPSFSKSFPQFSPISSPESEDMPSNGIDDRPKQMKGPYLPSGSLFASTEIPMSDNQRKPQAYSVIDKCHERDPVNETVNILKSNCTFLKEDEKFDCYSSDNGEKTGILDNPVSPMDDHHGNLLGTSKYITSESNSSSCPCVKTPTSKITSCLEALVALNARKDPSEQTKSRDLSVVLKETVKLSPKVPISPRSPRSPLEVVKRLAKQPDSPMSMCSDGSGKASPALATGSPPVVPRVRIKTIKTSSGQIQRTVTSVLPDSDPEDLQSPFESSPSQSSVEEAFSKMLPTYHSHDVISEVIFENGRSEASKVPLVGIISSKSKSEGNAKKAALIQPIPMMQSAPFSQNASGGVRRTPKGHKQRKVSSAQTGCPPNTNYLPKALHLANLNLVPHSVAASVTARSTSHRQSQPQLTSSVVCSSVPLVHQVKKATPNPHAVIPSTAAGTLNRLLNYSNPVPTYVPNLRPPPESNISLPTHGYRCLECGDSFGLERSLAYHYSRKSVHIEVACTHCSKTLVFFNKCALLAHAREHKNKGMVMQCTQLFMKPIAVDQMFAPAVAEHSVLRSSQASSAPSAKSQPVMPLYPDKIIRHELKCLECNKQMSDYRALAGHYQRTSGYSEGLMCKACSMLLPNKCSYKAHQRIHAHKSPYCCPECGAVSRSVDIQKHVKENCLHYARKVGYTCLHCDVRYMSFNLLKSHIEEKHCEVFYKCSICPVAFKSSDGCLSHIKNKHNGSEMSPQLIYKCSCETVFKKKQLLFQHFHQRTCVFKCPECTSFFTQKLLLVQHFKGVHGGVFRTEVEKSTKQTETTSHHQDAMPVSRQPKVNSPTSAAGERERESSAARKSNSALNLKNAGWTCGECLLWLPDRETYVTHMKTSHGRSVKRHPCRQCERSFNSSTSLRRHIRNDHDGKKKAYTCWYCTDERVTFTKHFMLKNHISLMHGIKNPDFSLMSKLAPQETSKAMGEGPKRTAEEAHGEGRGRGAPEASPAKRLKQHLRCSKCGFTTEDRAKFQEHIPQHKTDDDTPQCQHCGLCFTSPLALSRHLFIVHKVKETEEEEKKEEEVEREGGDLADEPRGERAQQEVPRSMHVNEKKDLGAPSEETDPSVLEEPSRLHCETCSKTFDRESSYRSHIPTHEMSGMPIEEEKSGQ